MKLPVMLYLDGDIIRDLKQRKVNISQMVNGILRFMLDASTESAEDIALALLKKDLQDTKGQLEKLNENHGRSQQRMESDIVIAKEKVEAQKKKVKEIRRSLEIAKIIRELNDKIVAENFDYERLKDSPLLVKLKEYSIPVDEKWLRRQIQRIELLGRF